jgi:hypothetical protein
MKLKELKSVVYIENNDLGMPVISADKASLFTREYDASKAGA